MNLDRRKIVEFRRLLIKARMGSLPDRKDLADVLDLHAGELLALADAALKIWGACGPVLGDLSGNGMPSRLADVALGAMRDLAELDDEAARVAKKISSSD